MPWNYKAFRMVKFYKKVYSVILKFILFHSRQFCNLIRQSWAYASYFKKLASRISPLNTHFIFGHLYSSRYIEVGFFSLLCFVHHTRCFMLFYEIKKKLEDQMYSCYRDSLSNQKGSRRQTYIFSQNSKRFVWTPCFFTLRPTNFALRGILGPQFTSTGQTSLQIRLWELNFVAFR